MIVGYDFFAGADSYSFDSRVSIGPLGEVELTNAVFDELNLTNDASAPFSTEKKAWNSQNILLAQFKGALNAGSIGAGMEITSIAVRKRKVGEFAWQPVTTIGFDDEVSVYSLYDTILKAGTAYEWAIVPIAGETEGTYIVAGPETLTFDGGFISDATHNYRLFYNLEIGDVITIRPNASFEPLSGSSYPIFSYAGDLKYRQSTVKALLSPTYDDAGGVDMPAEAVLREEIAEWLSNGEAKLYKLMDGTFMLVNITGDVTVSPWEGIDGKYLVSFSFTESGDAESAADLIDSGVVG